MSRDPQNTRIPPFGLRIPSDLKERVARAAADNQRSMNAEILATLEEKYPRPKLREGWMADLAVSLGFDPDNLSDENKLEMRAFVDDLLKIRDLDVSGDSGPPTVKGSARGRR